MDVLRCFQMAKIDAHAVPVFENLDDQEADLPILHDVQSLVTNHHHLQKWHHQSVLFPVAEHPVQELHLQDVHILVANQLPLVKKYLLLNTIIFLFKRNLFFLIVF